MKKRMVIVMKDMEDCQVSKDNLKSEVEKIEGKLIRSPCWMNSLEETERVMCA